MRVVLDTNVLVSGIFFSGPPYRILKAWRDSNLDFVVTVEILEEYERVLQELTFQFRQVTTASIMNLLISRIDIIKAYPLPIQV
jgi:uncharacterized protein